MLFYLLWPLWKAREVFAAALLTDNYLSPPNFGKCKSILICLQYLLFFRAQWVTLLLGVLCVVPSYWATIRRVLPTIWFVQTLTLNLHWVWFWPCIDFYFDFQFYFGHFRRVLTSYIYRENFFWFCYDSLPRTRLLRQKVFTHQRLSVLCLSILFSSGRVIEASWGRIIQHLIPTKTSRIFCSIPVMVPLESDSLNLAVPIHIPIPSSYLFVSLDY